MIYVTHDQVEAMTLADRIVVLNDGAHRAGRHAAGAVRRARPTCSSPASSARPKMNFLDGHAGSRPAPTQATRAAGRRQRDALRGRRRSRRQPGDTVTLGVRPEHLHAAGAGGQRPARPRSPSSSTLGEHHLAYCDCRRRRRATDRAHRPGQPACAPATRRSARRCRPKRCYLFDAQGLALPRRLSAARRRTRAREPRPHSNPTGRTGDA